MSSQEAKERAIGEVYFDLERGFGSIAETLRRAREIEPSVRQQDVQEYLARQEGNQKKKSRQNNSFVPLKQARLQYQIDLADFGAARGGTSPWYRYGLVAIDIFTKKTAVVPMQNKRAETAAQALDKVVRKLGPMAEVFTDEGGEFLGAFSERVREYYEATHRISRTPPIFVERFIRTLKDNVRKRLDALGDDDRWWAVGKQVVDKYNATEHTTTEISPDDLTDPNITRKARAFREEQAWLSIAQKAHRRRRYKPLEVGDRVKVIRKPGKYSEYKAGFVAWTESVHVVERVERENGTRLYTVSDFRRPLMRHELLKVEGVEAPPRERLREQRRAEAKGGDEGPLFGDEAF